MVRFQKRYRRAQHQPKLDLPGLKNEHCRKKFRQRVSISIGLGIKRKVEDLDSFTKCILEAAKKTLPEKHLKRGLHHQLECDRENGWTSRTKEFEKTWEDKNPRILTPLNRQAPSVPELEHAQRQI
ncbi:hypothetical protein RB195_018034 [Necator americanus]|uniref:Uncharacterized protein n=1 Tax=Necator americanus TaxID=51031 RepID=A0ABR1C9X0_NECAM